ncbi:MAG: hypothetical protein ACRCVT_08815, partial [Leadbetterella sp.]
MKKLIITLSLVYLVSVNLNAQNTSDALPYREIPNYPESYTNENIVTRMLDGLGFRYYWATEGLRPQDLNYKFADEARSIEATIDHLLGLSHMILNATNARVHVFSQAEAAKIPFDIKRKTTLENIKAASDRLRNRKVDLAELKIKLKRPDGSQFELPFWNAING